MRGGERLPLSGGLGDNAEVVGERGGHSDSGIWGDDHRDVCGRFGSGGGVFDACGRIFCDQFAGRTSSGGGKDHGTGISRDGKADGRFSEVGGRKYDDRSDGGGADLCGGNGTDFCEVGRTGWGRCDGVVVSLCDHVRGFIYFNND